MTAMTANPNTSIIISNRTLPTPDNQHFALTKKGSTMEKKVYGVPKEIDSEIGRLKLAAMGVEIDILLPEQEKYLASWDMGT